MHCRGILVHPAHDAHLPPALARTPAVRTRRSDASVTAPSPLSGFSRITLAAPKTRADVAVPNSVPVAAFLPVLLRQIGQDSEAGVPGHGGWRLCRVDGRRLDLSRSMDANEVRDGDVLVLQPQRAVVAVFGALSGLLAAVGHTGATRPAALIAPLALATTTVLPPLALRLARLPRPQLALTAPELAELPGEVDQAVTTQRVANARALLTGLTSGALFVTGVGCVALALSGNTWARSLAGRLVAL